MLKRSANNPNNLNTISALFSFSLPGADKAPPTPTSLPMIGRDLQPISGHTNTVCSGASCLWTYITMCRFRDWETKVGRLFSWITASSLSDSPPPPTTSIHPPTSSSASPHLHLQPSVCHTGVQYQMVGVQHGDQRR